jgi:hypothetical protein
MERWRIAPTSGPVLANLGMSAEQRTTPMLCFYASERAHPDSPEAGLLEVIIVKCRGISSKHRCGIRAAVDVKSCAVTPWMPAAEEGMQVRATK